MLRHGRGNVLRPAEETGIRQRVSGPRHPGPYYSQDGREGLQSRFIHVSRVVAVITGLRGHPCYHLVIRIYGEDLFMR